MRYYRYLPDADNFAGIGFSEADDKRIVGVHSTDTPLADSWVAPIAHGFEDNPRRDGDFPSLSNRRRIPIMSQRAWEALRPLIGNCCEVLPFIHPTGKTHFIVHVMETVDCLDATKSDLTRNEVSGRVNRVYIYAFKPGLLTDKHIFKLPRDSGGELIVDEVFRDIVETNNLRGLLFEELSVVE